MKKLKFDRGRFFQGVILFGFSVYLIKLLETGQMQLLVSPNIQFLLKVTLGLLIVMTFFALGTVFTSETVFVAEEEENSEHIDHHEHNHADQKHEHEIDRTSKLGRIHINLRTQNHEHNHEHDHRHVHGHVHEHVHGHDHDHRPKPRKGWLLITFPVIFGLTIPTQALGSSLLSSGIQSKIQIQKSQTLVSTTTQAQHAVLASNASPSVSAHPKNADFVDISKLPKLTVPASEMPPKPKPGTDISLGDLFSNLYTAPQYYFNQSMKITGFVYHPPGWPTNRLILIRYMITCCLADANPIGLTVEMNDAAKYPNDTWMQVEGTLSARVIPNGDTLPPIGWYSGTEEKPVLLGKVAKVIPQPKEPYLYPAKPSGFKGGNP